MHTALVGRLMIGTALGLIAVPAAAQTASGNVTQEAPRASATPTDQTQDREGTADAADIIVTGLRASLQNSAQIKKNTMEIVDSITADDIGKLPDPNVAETLTRIPGVQGYRFGGETAAPVGQGSGLTIRGLSNLTASRVDGRAYFTAGSREFNIESAIPGIVAGLDVFKNPAAEHIEGSIGGLINIRTRHPLDFKDDVALAASVTARYNDLAEKAKPEGFGLVSKKWDLPNGGEFGILAAGSYSQSINRGDNTPGNGGSSIRRAIRADSAEYAATPSLNRAYVGRSDVTYLLPLTNAQAQALPEATRQTLISAVTEVTPVNLEQYERTRIGADVAMQWKPNDKLEFNLTGVYNSYLYHQNYWFLAPNDSPYVQNLTTVPFLLDEVLATRNQNGGTNDTLATSRIASGRFLDSTFTSTGGDEHRKYQTGIVAFNARWEPIDRLETSLDVSYVKAKQYQDNRSVQLLSAPGRTYSITRDVLATPHTIQIEGPDLTSAANWIYNTYSNGTNQTWDDDGLSLQFDTKYSMPDSPLRALKAGIRYAYQTDEYHNYAFGNRPLTTDGLALNAGRTNAISAASAADLLGLSPSNFLDGKGGFNGQFLVFQPDSLLGDNVRGRFPLAGILPENSLAENLLNRRYFKEETTAAYLQGDFSILNDRIRGNLGVRAVRTDLFVRAQINNLTTTPATIVPNERRISYANVLPTANITGYITPDTLLRFGFGKGLTRPDPGALNPSISVDVNTGNGSQGNPNLRPQKADSYDLSLEHYFSGGNYVAVAGFYKRIDGFFSGIAECQTVATAPAYSGVINNTCPTGQYLVTRTVNAEKGDAKGVEVSGQTFFNYDFVPNFLHGFGASASFTYVDTKVPLVLNGIRTNTRQPFSSKYNYSVSALYEDKVVSARVVYTYRSDHVLFGVSANPIDGRYIKGYGLLDASLNFQLPANFAVSLTASNLTNQAPNRYVGEPGLATGIERQHFANGRVFGAALRYRLGR